jgi:hypothetical protein
LPVRSGFDTCPGSRAGIFLSKSSSESVRLGNPVVHLARLHFFLFGEGFPFFRELREFTLEKQISGIGREVLASGRTHMVFVSLRHQALSLNLKGRFGRKNGSGADLVPFVLRTPFSCQPYLTRCVVFV